MLGEQLGCWPNVESLAFKHADDRGRHSGTFICSTHVRVCLISAATAILPICFFPFAIWVYWNLAIQLLPWVFSACLIKASLCQCRKKSVRLGPGRNRPLQILLYQILCKCAPPERTSKQAVHQKAFLN